MDHPRHLPASSEPAQPADAANGARSNAVAAAVTAVMLGGIWWWTTGGSRSVSDVATQSLAHHNLSDGAKQSHTPRHPLDGATQSLTPRHPSANGNGNLMGDANGTTASIVSPPVVGRPLDGATQSLTPLHPPFDASRGSWQNPFQAAYWHSSGWEFEPGAMQSSGGEPATATFRRDYHKIAIDCDVTAIGKPGTFQIRLFSPDSDALLEADFTADAVTIVAEIDGRRTVVKRRTVRLPFAADKPAILRFTATGNRLLVASGKRVLINCSQPAEQSGKALKLSLCSEGGAFRVTRLHFEGQ